jgi:hypothetical protein
MMLKDHNEFRNSRACKMQNNFVEGYLGKEKSKKAYSGMCELSFNWELDTSISEPYTLNNQDKRYSL